MKLLYGSVLATTAIAQSSLPNAFSKIPSCSYSALANAMNQEGCSTSSVRASTIECLCSNIIGVSYDVAYTLSLSSMCLTQFAQALSYACAIYLTDDTPSDVSAAAQVLASQVGGSAVTQTSYPSGTTSSRSIYQVTATGPSPIGPSLTGPSSGTTSSRSLIQVTATGPSPTATSEAPVPLIAGDQTHSPNIAGPAATLGLLVPVAAVGVFLL